MKLQALTNKGKIIKALLAKSCSPGDRQVGLFEHSRQCADIGALMVDLYGQNAIDTLNLNCSLEYLKNTVFFACLWHDVGKANSHFQAMVRNNLETKQQLRHEFISGLLMKQTIGKEVDRCESFSFYAALYAVTNHHLKDDFTPPDGSGLTIQDIDTLHPDIQKIIDVTNKKLGTSITLDKRFSINSKTARKAANKYNEEKLQPNDKSDCNFSPLVSLTDYNFCALVRSYVIQADSLASVKEPHKIRRQWLKQSIENVFSRDDLVNLLDSSLAGREPLPFQVDAGKSTARLTVVTAGTGSGKTICSQSWMRTHAIARKVIFCTPQRGVSLQIYMDSFLGKVDGSSFLCSGSNVYLDLMTNVSDEADIKQEDLRQDAQDDWDEKFASKHSLESITSKMICTTSHGAVSFLGNNRKGLVSLAAMVNSAVIFDEIHSGGQDLQAFILEFLRSVKVPVLVMSATLSQEFIQQLSEAVGGDINIISGHKPHENLLRYKLKFSPDYTQEEMIHKAVKYAQEQGKKVLFVVNTIKDCQEVYRQIKSLFPDTLIYHSQYILEDRFTKQKELVAAFRSDKPVIAVTTQVCEMSLDITCDVLITQLCPIESLIQRLGRNNRYGKELGICYVYTPRTHYPYSQELLDACTKSITSLLGKTISQADLNQAAIAAQSMLSTNTIPNKRFPFFEAGITAKKCAVGQYDTVSVVPQQYIRAVKCDRKNSERYSISVSSNRLARDERVKIKKTFCYKCPDHMVYNSEIGLHSHNQGDTIDP